MPNVVNGVLNVNDTYYIKLSSEIIIPINVLPCSLNDENDNVQNKKRADNFQHLLNAIYEGNLYYDGNAQKPVSGISTLYFPAGLYKFHRGNEGHNHDLGGINVRCPNITIRGCGYGDLKNADYINSTVFLFDESYALKNSSGNPRALSDKYVSDALANEIDKASAGLGCLNVLASRVTIRDLSVSQNSTSTYPTIYPPAIYLRSKDSHPYESDANYSKIINVKFSMMTFIGIRVDASATSISDIVGHSNYRLIHFNRYSAMHPNAARNLFLVRDRRHRYTKFSELNGVVLYITGAEHLVVDRVFALGFDTFAKFHHGEARKFKFSHIDLDTATCLLDVSEDCGVVYGQVQSATLKCDLTENTRIYPNAVVSIRNNPKELCIFQMTNVSIAGCNGSAIHIQNPNNQLQLVNAELNMWGLGEPDWREPSTDDGRRRQVRATYAVVVDNGAAVFASNVTASESRHSDRKWLRVSTGEINVSTTSSPDDVSEEKSVKALTQKNCAGLFNGMVGQKISVVKSVPPALIIKSRL